MQYYYEGQYNETDNLIFDQLEPNYSKEVERITTECYQLLLQKNGWATLRISLYKRRSL